VASGERVCAVGVIGGYNLVAALPPYATNNHFRRMEEKENP